MQLNKISLDNSPQAQINNDRLLREVVVVSRLQNQHIVRYYQAWFEEVDEDDLSDKDSVIQEDPSEESEEEESEKTPKRPKSESRSEYTTSQGISRRFNKYAYNSDSDDSDSNSDSDDLVFEKGSNNRNDSSDESSSKKSETITNKKKLLKKENQKMKPEPKEKPKKRRLYIQMEFCQRDTLRSRIEKGIENENEIWKYMEQILKALNYVHSMGLLHRDLKPANIFLDKDFNVKLGDFGLVQEVSKSKISLAREELNHQKEEYKEINIKRKISDSLSEEMSTGIGTFFYMSPEQESEKNYNQKTDMFSLGIILFEMWANMKSYMERDRALKYLRQHYKVPSEYEKKIPKDLTIIIEKLISKNPDNRPTAKELLNNHFVDPTNIYANDK